MVRYDRIASGRDDDQRPIRFSEARGQYTLLARFSFEEASPSA